MPLGEALSKLTVKITADTKELGKALSESGKDIEGIGKTIEKETKSWQEQFKGIGKIALGLGASITAAMTGAILSFSKAGSELYDLSLKTGVSAKALAGLKYAAEQGGASIGTIEMAIRRTAVAIEEAKDSTTGSSKAFDKMGISLSDLQGLNPEQQFLKIATAIANIPDPMARAALAVDLFGRSGTDMLPMLSEGADGLKKMMEEGQKLTGWTDEGAKSADALGDAFNTLKTSTMGIFNAIASALAPTLKDLVDKITDISKTMIGWAKEHPELTKQIGLLALALGGFLTLAGTFMMLAPTIAAAWAVAMGPVGLITLAITGLIAAGILLWQNWDKVSHFFADAWSNMKTVAFRAVDAILAALDSLLGWIPGFGTKIDEAREKLANMIETEKICRDIQDAQRGYQELQTTIDETGKKAKGLASSLDPELIKAQDAARESTKKLRDEQEKLNADFADLMHQLVFNETEAGQLCLTMDDVYTAMYKLGYKTEEIQDVFRRYGDITEIDEALLDKLGLTAQQVAKEVGKLKEITDIGTESFKKYSEASKDALASAKASAQELYAAYKELGPEATARERESAFLAGARGRQEVAQEIKAAHPGMTNAQAAVEAAKATVPGYPGGSLQHGGIVKETGLSYLHKGETVLPSDNLPAMGNQIIEIILDGEIISRHMINRLSRKAALQGAR